MDKKLTANEIKKALECCAKGTFNCDGECPRSYNNSLSISACRFELLGDVLDLLNRNDAEIERLNVRNKTLAAIIKNYDWKFTNAKSEAIKEFAERLTEKADKYGLKYWATVEDIDNLVKEMTNDLKE